MVKCCVKGLCFDFIVYNEEEEISTKTYIHIYIYPLDFFYLWGFFSPLVYLSMISFVSGDF